MTPQSGQAETLRRGSRGTGIGPKTATAHADRYQRLQDLLGEHQDSLVSAEVLRRLGAKAG